MSWGRAYDEFPGQEYTRTKLPRLWNVILLFCWKVRWLNALTWLPLFSHWQTQHVRYINLISLEHVVHAYDTSVEDSLKKSEGFSCLIEALVVPSVARSLSLTSSEQVQLRKQLYILPCLTGIIGISFWPLPLVCHPWSAEIHQVVHLVLTDGHTLQSILSHKF